jgi:nucleoside 2-deoxyribosyltransferase
MANLLDLENSRHIECFVIIPFDKEFHPVWEAIQEVAANLGAEGKDVGVHRASENKKADFLTHNVFTNIDDCDIAIIDTTGQNKNVIFEFGYAIAKNKYIIPITQDDIAEMAGDYRGYIYLKYDKTNISMFKLQLRQRIIEERRDIGKDIKNMELTKKVVAEQDHFPVDCIRNRRFANLNEAFENARYDIKIIQTNMTTVVSSYADSMHKALENQPSLELSFLALDPESYFAAVRAQQIGKDVSEFRDELHSALYSLHNTFKAYPGVEIRTYDDFPTQICFIVDDVIYNCVVSKYQQSRNNVLFKLDSSYPAIHTSFILHFTSVWRDINTTRKYTPRGFRTIARSNFTEDELRESR